MSERHSLAFRKFQIWADCKKHGWDRSAEEIGEGIGREANYGHTIVSAAGWTGRIGDREKARRSKQRNAARLGQIMGRRFDENTMDVTELMRGTL